MPAAQVQQVNAEFPAKLEPLWKPFDYKVIRGGRGSGKSWGVARTLLIMAMQKRLRVLCARETQKSLRQSVHSLLTDQIARLGIANRFEVLQDEIRSSNGSRFNFVGLSDQTADSLKSYEGADICWVEEGQVVTEYSWSILDPTIRKTRDDGTRAEIWVTFNPELDSDPTWKRFIENPPPNTLQIEINWRDNPWFNELLNSKRQHAAQTLPLYEYEWIWEGKCKPAISGAVYADEVAAMYAENRVGDYPYDAFQPVYAVFDLGWNDKMAIVVVQRVVSQLRIIDYIENDHQTLDFYSQQLRQRPYSINELFLPHDGAQANLQTGQSTQRVLQGLNWSVSVLPNSPVEDGIRAARMAFKSLYVNRKNCERLLECLKRYRRAIPSTTGEPSRPLHDEFSHGADAYRYVCQAAPQMGNTADGGGLKLPPLKYNFDFNRGMRA